MDWGLIDIWCLVSVFDLLGSQIVLSDIGFSLGFIFCILDCYLKVFFY